MSNFVSYNWVNSQGITAYRNDGSAVFIEPNHANWADAVTQAGPYIPPPEPTPEEILERERASWWCSRRQGKLVLGEEKWNEVVALADDPDMPWGLRVAVHDTYEWHRNSEEMAALIWAMGLTEEEADDLFRAAMAV